MSTIAIEAALAELTAWRREAERKIARLEAEVADLGGGTDMATKVDAIPGVAFAAGALPAPSHALAKDGHAPWAPAAPATFAAPVPVPVAPLVHAVPIPAPTPHPAVAPPPAPSSASALEAVPIAVASAPAPVAHPPPAPPAPHQAPAFREVRPQYDLTMKPGESVDLPSGLDGGRRKKRMGMIAAFLLVAGMAVLVISALASQR
jgi:hypothetical protein